MSRFPLDKYKYYFATDVNGMPYKVYAVSSYAGRSVKGGAKCNPRDGFNEEAGKRLAALRCNKKVAERRMARAAARLKEAEDWLRKAEKSVEKYREYYSDAVDLLAEAKNELEDCLEEM